MELDDIRAWDLGALEQLEDSLSRRIEAVADVQLQLADIGRLPAWLSEAGEVARRRFQVTSDDLTDEAAALSAVGECARQTREAVAHLKTELADIEADAAADGMQVDDSGAVKVVDTAERSPEEAEAREQRRVEPVTTPGVGTTVNGSFDAMVDEAKNLRDLSSHELGRSIDHKAETVATIGWLGYEAPNDTGPGNLDAGRGGADAASEAKASEAAPRLAQFLEGLEVASHEADGADKNPHITAVGHSYGSLVTGMALGEPGEAADDMVVYGSPGIAADKTEQLGIDHGHGYTMLGDADDWIDDPTLLEWFGPDPHTNPNFTHLSTDPGTTPDGASREGAHEHADYPRTGSDGRTLRISGYNIAAVVAGLPELAVRE